MLYSLITFFVTVIYTIFTAKVCINIGMKLGEKGIKEVKILPKVPRKVKESSELKRYNDIMWNIENFHGRGSAERAVK